MTNFAPTAHDARAVEPANMGGFDNRMKMSQTESEFLKQVARIYKLRIEEI
jgi:hypothetical protein